MLATRSMLAHLLLVSIAAAALVAGATAAVAQPSVAPYAPPPPPPPPPPAQETWGIGLHLVGLSVADARLEQPEPEDFEDLSGAGALVRYRLSPRWGLELAIDHLEDAAKTRTHRAVSLGASLHLTPYSDWSWYLALGLGGANDELETSGGSYQIDQSHAYVGLGLERRIGQLGLGGELRAVGMARHDEQSDLGVPAEASGAALTLGITYYVH